MNKKDDVKYKRLIDNDDDVDARHPLLAVGYCREGSNRSPVEGPRTGNASLESGSGGLVELSHLRLRAEKGNGHRSVSAEAEKTPCFDRQLLPGDTLRGISVQYSCPVALLKQVNHLITDQEFHGLKTIRIPVKKYGLLPELIALENEAHSQKQAAAISTAGAMASAAVHGRGHCLDAPGAARYQTCPSQANTVSSCSDSSDYENDPLVPQTSANSGRPASKGCSRTDGGTEHSESTLMDFLRNKDIELRNIAEKVNSRPRLAHETVSLMRTSPTFPLEIERVTVEHSFCPNWCSHNNRWVVILVALFVLVLVSAISYAVSVSAAGS